MHLENIYLDKNHPAHEDLKYDLDTIKKEEILTYYKKHEKRINFLNRKIKKQNDLFKNITIWRIAC